MKNIGFLMVKQKYPENYKNITLVFNDVDTFPLDKTTIPDYSTTPGIIKHFYGYHYALGGIVSIQAGDFEKLNGFPNYYSWGFEDNELNERALKNKMIIDRSIFYPISDKINIIQLSNGVTRTVNRGEFDRYARKIQEGIDTIYNLQYVINEENQNVSVLNFETKHMVDVKLNSIYDITKGKSPFTIGYSAKRRTRMNLIM